MDKQNVVPNDKEFYVFALSTKINQKIIVVDICVAPGMYITKSSVYVHQGFISL